MIPIFRELRGIFAVLWNDCRGEFKPKSLVPKHEIDAFVHTFYPVVVAFFQTEEGRRAFEEWKAKRDEEKKKKTAEEKSSA